MMPPINPVAAQYLKDAMGYTPKALVCEDCTQFVMDNCELNPAGFFPVDKGGRCRHHKPNTQKEESARALQCDV